MGRLFNFREGLDPASERLDPAALEQAKRAYFARMGWAPDTGRPPPETLRALDLAWTAKPAGR